MTFNRVGEHRLLRQRQLGETFPGGNGAGGETGTSTETEASGNGGNTAVPSSASSAGPASSTVVSSSAPPSSTVPTSTAEPSTTSTTVSTSTSRSSSSSASSSPSTSVAPTSEIASTTSSSSSTSSIITSTSSTSTSSSTSSTRATSSVDPTTALLATSSADDNSRTLSRSVTRTASAGGTTVTASDSAKPVGALNTGALVGGIAGGLVAVAALGLLICFFLRRRSRQRRNEEWNASQFRRSAMVMPEEQFAPPPTLPDVTPQMHQHSHAPSVTSMTGPGLAGQGAFYNARPDPQQYSDHPYATSPPPRMAPMPIAAPLRERQQYVFGQTPGQQMPEEHYDNMNGVYSAEPQMQTVYNPEAYSGYHAYSPDVHQAQSAGYVAEGYPGNEHAHPSGAYAAGAHPSNGYVQESSHGRSKSATTVVDDAYGGI